MDYADIAYRNTYSVDLKNVTEEMLREAESLVNLLRIMDTKRLFRVAAYHTIDTKAVGIAQRAYHNVNVVVAQHLKNLQQGSAAVLYED